MGQAVKPFISLPEALYRLLFKRSYRQAFIEGNHHLLGLSEWDLKQLRTIDHEELQATAKNICRNLLSGNLDTNGGLLQAYPGVFQELKNLQINSIELMYEFMETSFFDDYREVPFGGEGICVEEAFYYFLQNYSPFIEASPYNKLMLTHEFLTSLLSILVINKDPHFVVKTDQVICNGKVLYAVQYFPSQIVAALMNRPVEIEEQAESEIPFLYAATEKTLIKGPINELTIELIRLGDRKAIGRTGLSLCERFAISKQDLIKIQNSLSKLGLIC
jgi:hypothetical protein